MVLTVFETKSSTEQIVKLLFHFHQIVLIVVVPATLARFTNATDGAELNRILNNIYVSQFFPIFFFHSYPDNNEPIENQQTTFSICHTIICAVYTQGDRNAVL